MNLSRLSLYCLDRLIDISPVLVPRIFHKASLFVLGNRLTYSIVQGIFRSKLSKTKSINKILVVVDLNLGDAVIVQPIAAVLRQRFPYALIDYACNSTGGELLDGMKEADHVFRLYINNGLPGHEQISGLRETLNRESYDLILNLCPFLSKKIIGKKASGLQQLYIPLSSRVIRLWLLDRGNRHISFVIDSFMHDFLASGRPELTNPGQDNHKNRQPQAFKGNTVYLSASDVREAEEFLRRHSLLDKKGIVVFHPDTPSIYTLMPVGLQINILRLVLESEYTGAVLLGIGRSFAGIEHKIISGLPEALKSKIVIIPDMPIRAYAALIDAADMFVSADTGPVHIAAARKVLNDNNDISLIRNRTAIVTIYGATDPKMYGYDSEKSGFQPSNQDAPARVFAAPASCRNISCIDKLMKTCRTIRCFNGLDPGEIALYITTCLSGTLPVKDLGNKGRVKF